MTKEEQKIADIEEEKKMEEELEDLHERLVGKGIAIALEVFRDKGQLSKNISFGRNKD